MTFFPSLSLKTRVSSKVLGLKAWATTAQQMTLNSQWSPLLLSTLTSPCTVTLREDVDQS